MIIEVGKIKNDCIPIRTYNNYQFKIPHSLSHNFIKVFYSYLVPKKWCAVEKDFFKTKVPFLYEHFQWITT